MGYMQGPFDNRDWRAENDAKLEAFQMQQERDKVQERIASALEDLVQTQVLNLRVGLAKVGLKKDEINSLLLQNNLDKYVKEVEP